MSLVVKKINLLKVYTFLWKVKISEGTNKIIGTIGYKDDFAGWFPRAPSIGSPHPDIPALLLKDLESDREEGDVISVVLSYECNNPEANYPGRSPGKIKRYGLDLTTGEEPLLKNKLFKDLTEAELDALQEFMGSSRKAEDFTKVRAAVTSAQGIKAIEKISRGIESFLNPGMVWRERFSTKNLSDVDLSDVAKPTNTPPGPCPSAGSERDWFYLGASAEETTEGGIFDIEKRWQLSEKGKTDEDLYS